MQIQATPSLEKSLNPLETPQKSVPVKDERFLFISQFFKNPQLIGSILPSSGQLVTEILHAVRQPVSESRYFLEVGPGTGSITDKIVLLLKPEDRLDLVEKDLDLSQHLRKKYLDHKNIYVFNKGIEEWQPGYQYDAIVSGLPLNSFPAPLVDIIFKKFLELAKPQGTLSYFEYRVLPKLKTVWLKACHKEEELSNFKEVLKIKDQFVKVHGTKIVPVRTNLVIPANVVHCQMDANINI